MASLIQFASQEADPAAPTFAAIPTEGNLLVATMAHRKDTPNANFTISGTGWVKRIARDTSLGVAADRRSFACATKIAGSNEPVTVTMDDGTTDIKIGSIAEYAHTTGENEWTFLEGATNDNGSTDNATSLATGTTATTTGDQKFLIAVLTARRAAHTATWTTAWTSVGLTAGFSTGALSAGNHISSGHGNSNANGTKASTGTISGTDTTNQGLSAGIMVFRTQIAEQVGASEYAVEVEFVSGSFTNITGDVKHIQINREMADLFHGISAGECNIELYNVSGKYSPSKPGGAFSGNLTSNKRVSVSVFHSPETHQLFRGFTDEWQVDGNTGLLSTAVMRSRDLIRSLRDISITTSFFTDYNVASVFAEVFLDTDIRSFTVDGLSDTLATAWWQEQPADAAINEIISLGYYRAFVSGDGVFKVLDRYFDQFISTQGSYNEFLDFGFTVSDGAVMNDVFMESAPRVQNTNPSTLAFTVSAITIQPSKSVAFVMGYINPENNLQVPSVDLITPVQSSDWIVGLTAGTGIANSTSTSSVSVLFHAETCVATVFNGSGNTVFLNKFQIRGFAVPESPRLSIRTQNSSSQNVFRRRSFVLSNDKLPGAQYMRDYQDFLIDRLRDPVPLVTAVVRNQRPDIFGLDVAKRVSIVNSHTGVRSAHVITRLEHDISADQGFVHTVTVEAERLRVYSLFTLDDATLGKLDSGNVLAF